MKVYLGPYEDNHPRDIDIVIDPYDSWNADATIAIIAAPLLEQLRKEKHGCANVEDEDVPEYLRSYNAPPKEHVYDIDDNYIARYDWMLREVIWALNEVANGYPEEKSYFHHNPVPDNATFQQQIDAIDVDTEGFDKYESRLQKALTLFGKYLRTFWD